MDLAVLLCPTEIRFASCAHALLKSHVQANVFTMGRDPAYFPEPLRFLPDRWLRDGEDYDDDLARRRQLISGLPFGHGSRMCIGL